MRTLLIFFLLVSSVFGMTLETPADSSRRNIHDRWFATDKAHHFLVSAFTTAAVNYSTREEMGYSSRTSKTISIGVSFSVGLFKEVYDGTIREKHFSYKDLVADCAGIITGIIIFNATE